jgi:hypothetical protein
MFGATNIKLYVRVKLASMSNHQTIQRNQEMKVKLAALTQASDGDEWLVQWAGRFTSGEENPGTQWTGGWAGPQPLWT